MELSIKNLTNSTIKLMIDKEVLCEPYTNIILLIQDTSYVEVVFSFNQEDVNWEENTMILSLKHKLNLQLDKQSSNLNLVLTENTVYTNDCYKIVTRFIDVENTAIVLDSKKIFHSYKEILKDFRKKEQKNIKKEMKFSLLLFLIEMIFAIFEEGLALFLVLFALFHILGFKFWVIIFCYPIVYLFYLKFIKKRFKYWIHKISKGMIDFNDEYCEYQCIKFVKSELRNTIDQL